MKPKICLPPSPPTPPCPEFCGLAAVLRRCCSFFSSSPSPAFFCSPFPLQAQRGLAQPRSEQGEETTGHQNILISFFFFFSFSQCMKQY